MPYRFRNKSEIFLLSPAFHFINSHIYGPPKFSNSSLLHRAVYRPKEKREIKVFFFSTSASCVTLHPNIPLHLTLTSSSGKQTIPYIANQKAIEVRGHDWGKENRPYR
jgi:hypothetical protein